MGWSPYQWFRSAEKLDLFNRPCSGSTSSGAWACTAVIVTVIKVNSTLVRTPVSLCCTSRGRSRILLGVGYHRYCHVHTQLGCWGWRWERGPSCIPCEEVQVTTSIPGYMILKDIDIVVICNNKKTKQSRREINIFGRFIAPWNPGKKHKYICKEHQGGKLWKTIDCACVSHHLSVNTQHPRVNNCKPPRSEVSFLICVCCQEQMM